MTTTDTKSLVTGAVLITAEINKLDYNHEGKHWNDECIACDRIMLNAQRDKVFLTVDGWIREFRNQIESSPYTNDVINQAYSEIHRLFREAAGLQEA